MSCTGPRPLWDDDEKKREPFVSPTKPLLPYLLLPLSPYLVGEKWGGGGKTPLVIPFVPFFFFFRARKYGSVGTAGITEI